MISVRYASEGVPLGLQNVTFMPFPRSVFSPITLLHGINLTQITHCFSNPGMTQGHPTDRFDFGKLSVRKALNPLQFSKGNFHLVRS